MPVFDCPPLTQSAHVQHTAAVRGFRDVDAVVGSRHMRQIVQVSWLLNFTQDGKARSGGERKTFLCQTQRTRSKEP